MRLIVTPLSKSISRNLYQKQAPEAEGCATGEGGDRGKVEKGDTGETGDTGDTGENGDTVLTGSTVLRHEVKPKMGEISNSSKF